MKREKIDKRSENLWLPTTVDWSYRANRFELGSRSDPASWLEELYSVLWLAVVNWQVCCYWLLVNLILWCIIDSYRSMLVRFALPATRGFISPLLSLSCLVSSRRKKTSGTRIRSPKQRIPKNVSNIQTVKSIHAIIAHPNFHQNSMHVNSVCCMNMQQSGHGSFKMQY